MIRVNDHDGAICGCACPMISTKAGSRSKRSAARRPRLADLWDAWCFAAAEASLTLDDWRRAPQKQRALAFLHYRHALLREEQAAVALEQGVRAAR